MTTTVVVGGPVCKRDWILEKWFSHVHQNYWLASGAGELMSIDYVFAVPSWDRDTQEIIRGCKPTAEIIEIKEPQRTDQRVWNPNRYGHMVELRNTVLERVREIEPVYFWSLDSDILPETTALNRALCSIGDYDAVGMRTWMTPTGKEFPSYAMLRGDPLAATQEDVLFGRMDQDHGVLPVHVIMASKLMTPAAYAVDYELHKNGEDVGWSKACLRAGLRLGWSAEARCKHVMAPELLDRVDPRLGW